MATLCVVFTKSPKSLVSWLIRWALPRSRFSWALTSHAMPLIDNTLYSAELIGGIKKVSYDEGMKGRDIVCVRKYEITNKDAAIAWLDAQVGKPYDWKAALGLGINPSRNWTDENRWYCYELVAGALRAGGRDEFGRLSHITETALLAIHSGFHFGLNT